MKPEATEETRGEFKPINVTDKYYKVESFGRTLYYVLGIDATQELYTTSNRPLKIILEDAPLIPEAVL
jgi:hypothetical protein